MPKVSRKSGFTLIELMVVIAIIGLLASIVLASLAGAKSRAQLSYVASEMGEVQKAVDLYTLDNNGAYPCPDYLDYYLTDFFGAGFDTFDSNVINGSTCLSKYFPKGLTSTPEQSLLDPLHSNGGSGWPDVDTDIQYYATSAGLSSNIVLTITGGTGLDMKCGGQIVSHYIIVVASNVTLSLPVASYDDSGGNHLVAPTQGTNYAYCLGE